MVGVTGSRNDNRSSAPRAVAGAAASGSRECASCKESDERPTLETTDHAGTPPLPICRCPSLDDEGQAAFQKIFEPLAASCMSGAQRTG
jgi:hypothetical protein